MRVSTPWRSMRVLSWASTTSVSPRSTQSSPHRSRRASQLVQLSPRLTARDERLSSFQLSPRLTARDERLSSNGALSPEGRGCQDGGPTWSRTKTGPVMSRGLCQLSYGPAGGDHGTAHDSRKLRSFLEREGWRSLRRALASI